MSKTPCSLYGPPLPCCKKRASDTELAQLRVELGQAEKERDMAMGTCDIWQGNYERVLAENRKLREALETVRPYRGHGPYEGLLRGRWELIRAALAALDSPGEGT